MFVTKSVKAWGKTRHMGEVPTASESAWGAMTVTSIHALMGT